MFNYWIIFKVLTRLAISSLNIFLGRKCENNYEMFTLYNLLQSQMFEAFSDNNINFFNNNNNSPGYARVAIIMGIISKFTEDSINTKL